MSPLEFSTADASLHADAGQLEQWIYRYLAAGEWANIGLLNGLQLQQRWWIGPIEVELVWLNRCCGPEPGMEYPVPQTAWDEHIARLSSSLTDSLDVPPLIVVYNAGEFSVRDGNHRHEAMRLKGWLKCWVVIWHNSLEDFEASQKLLADRNGATTTG
jgi:hypothetical protein